MDCPICRAPGMCICDPAPVAGERLLADLAALERAEGATVAPDTSPPAPLTFAALRAANRARLPLFRNARGEPAHSAPDGSDWTLGDWATATLGELGEAAHIVKKIRRGDLSLEAARPALADELADTATYLDIFAAQCGVDLGAAVAGKFDRVSARVGAPVSLAPTPRDLFLGLIRAERERQVAEECHTPEADDLSGRHGDLAIAAAAYCFAAHEMTEGARAAWPWNLADFKPKGARRDLVRAGALILAELERLKRAEPSLPMPLPPHAAPPGAAPDAGR